MDTKSRVTYVCGECGEENKGKLGVWEKKKTSVMRKEHVLTFPLPFFENFFLLLPPFHSLLR